MPMRLLKRNVISFKMEEIFKQINAEKKPIGESDGAKDASKGGDDADQESN